ncbi:UDP-glucuronosyltransferase 2B15 [Acyrthosiphon pisum]|uniref:UDP-glucuronosyltransferase n=1 Tax=Acyrthosiphon pisum TaxID=7029 RepID=A0A8R2A2V3_ACYPI|nr:UDP-glucuronosyltransferase 2B15 [Acyrthosiphon pisum]|eukprot:XP_001944591.2 PREDICTED: UDP-glucuronosyltransferase 2B15 [Acyrthosiphon pisum]
MYLKLFSILFYTFAGSWIPAPVESANILAVETVGCKSHWNFMSSILRALVDNGHNVTVFTPFADGNRENYTEVSTGATTFLEMNIEDLMDKSNGPIKFTSHMLQMSRTMCNVIYENSKMKEVLSNTRSDFDIVITEPSRSECVSYLAIKLNLPLIYLQPVPTMGIMERMYTGHMSNPAVVANKLASFGVPKTFVQRTSNLAILISCTIIREFNELIMKFTEPKEYDLHAPIPPSLVFINSHFTIEPASPIPSNVVAIGGIHLNLKATKKLPKDILDFIEQSPHGVVYFTFGSIVKMTSLPEHIKKALIDGLAQIPQRVLWKYEDEIENLPKNVMVRKWLPQREILLHPNVKLFISHGGISGLYEAIDGSVPILGFPLFADQPKNIDNLVNAGIAISMDILSITKDAFLKNVLELLNNEKYMENVKTASKIFKDRPMSPASLVVYWTEYVLRHKGAPHLTSHAMNLLWYQYYLLDVIALILVFIIVVIIVSYRIFKSISKYFSKYSRNTKSKSE